MVFLSNFPDNFKLHYYEISMNFFVTHYASFFVATDIRHESFKHSLLTGSTTNLSLVISSIFTWTRFFLFYFSEQSRLDEENSYPCQNIYSPREEIRLSMVRLMLFWTPLQRIVAEEMKMIGKNFLDKKQKFCCMSR